MPDYDDLNSNLRDTLGAQPRHRLIVYALDPAFFPDDAYHGFPAFVLKANGDLKDSLVRYQCVTRLFWIRRFFETGDGHNVWQVMLDAFAGRLSRYDLVRHVATQLPVPFDGVDTFLHDAWLVGGNPDQDNAAGETSQIWKFLTPLVRRLSAGPTISNDAVSAICQDYADRSIIEIAPFFTRLIQERDADFFDSLRALRCQVGEGWLTRIHALWNARQDRPEVRAAWMLYRNGNDRRIDLVVNDVYVPDNGSLTLSIKQASKTIVTRDDVSAGQTFSFSVPVLVEGGLNVHDKVEVRIGDRGLQKLDSLRETLSTDDPVLFRYPLRPSTDDCWLRMINGKETFYARRIAVLMPADVQNLNFTLGAQAVTAEDRGRLDVWSGENRRLLVINLDGIHSSEPQELLWDGRKLASIGHRPSIDVINRDPTIGCPTDDAIIFVRQTPVLVKLVNAVPAGGPCNWTCEGGLIAGNCTEATVTPTTLGVPIRVACDGATAKIVALPPSAFDNTPSSAWSWKLSTDDITVVENGFEDGTLSGPDGVCFRLRRPLTRLVWWWSKGVFGSPESVGQRKDFNDRSEAQPYRLKACVPIGQNLEVRVGAKGTQLDLIKTLDGGSCCHTINLNEVLNKCPVSNDIGNVIDELLLGDTEVAHILRVPSRPVLLLHGGAPHVFFPQGVDPAAYSVACLYESGIKVDAVEVVACNGMQSEMLVPVPIKHSRVNGEEMWLVLVQSSAKPMSLVGFPPYGVHVEIPRQIHPPTKELLKTRCGVKPDSEGANRLRGVLDFLAEGSDWFRRNGVFSKAIAERYLLDYPNRAEFWCEHYKKHCRIDAPPNGTTAPLEETLTTMLRVGFNWCAEPKWLSHAKDAIPEAMGWTRMTAGRRSERRDALRKLCLPILVQSSIEAGFPACDRQLHANVKPVASLLDNLPSHVLCVCLANDPNNPRILVKRHNRCPFGQNGINIADRWKSVNICYHACNSIKIGQHWEPFRIGLAPNARDAFLRLMLSRDNERDESILSDEHRESLRGAFDEGDESILSDEHRESLRGAFDLAMKVSVDVVGNLDDDGLATMLSLTRDGYADSGSPGRSDIFQAAALSRLNAWLGLSGEPYPADWPLLTGVTGDLVCYVIRWAWQDDNRRNVLMNDLITVEWLLTWCHL